MSKMFQVAGNTRERIDLVDGTTQILTSSHGPFKPQRTPRFERLIEQGRVFQVEVEDEDDVVGAEDTPADEEGLEEPEESLEEPAEVEEQLPTVEEDTRDDDSVESLGLDGRISSALTSAGIEKVSELEEFSADDLLEVDGLAEKSVEKIQIALNQ